MAIYMNQAVQELCVAIGPMETEWDATKLQTKITEYLTKASKAVSGSIKPWNAQVQEFSEKFFDVFFTGLGDRPWVDKVDYTLVVGAGIQALVPPLLPYVQLPEFMPVCLQSTQLGFDYSRYYSWGSQTVKKVIQGPKTQKKIREAVDTARDGIVKDMNMMTPEEFIMTWCKATKKALEDSGSIEVLPRVLALQLFQELIAEGGGLPKPMSDSLGGIPPPEWAALTRAVNDTFEDEVPWEEKKKREKAAKPYEPDKWVDYGNGRTPQDPAALAAGAAMMQQMMAMMQQKGGMPGMDGKGGKGGGWDGDGKGGGKDKGGGKGGGWEGDGKGGGKWDGGGKGGGKWDDGKGGGKWDDGKGGGKWDDGKGGGKWDDGKGGGKWDGGGKGGGWEGDSKGGGKWDDGNKGKGGKPY